jgi:hypothetical protein
LSTQAPTDGLTPVFFVRTLNHPRSKKTPSLEKDEDDGIATVTQGGPSGRWNFLEVVHDYWIRNGKLGTLRLTLRLDHC